MISYKNPKILMIITSIPRVEGILAQKRAAAHANVEDVLGLQFNKCINGMRPIYENVKGCNR